MLKGWFDASLGAKIAAGYVLMGVLVLVCAGAGYYGMTTLGSSLDYLVGAAWETADGAMESSIGIEAQMIAVDQIMNGVDIADNKRTLETARKDTLVAWNRILAAKTIEVRRTDDLQKDLDRYETSINRLLEIHGEFEIAAAKLRAIGDKFVAVSEELEQVGDKQVESLEQNPDQQVSWNKGLKERWDAADGGMESSIGYLTQMYYIAQMQAGRDIAECKAEIEKAKAFHLAAMNAMLSTKAFDVPLKRHVSAEFTGQQIGKVYAQLYDQHRAALDQFVATFSRLKAAQTEYEAIAKHLLLILDEFEDDADGKVESMKTAIQTSKFQVALAIFGSAAASLLIGIVSGMYSTRSVTRPVNETVAILKDIAQGEGDLTRRLNAERGDQLGQMAQWFNVFVERLQSIIGRIAENSTTMVSAADSLEGVSLQLARGASLTTGQATAVATATEELSANMRSMAASMEEMSATTKAVATSAEEMTSSTREIARSAEDAATVASEAATLVKSSYQKIEHLGNDAEAIGKVIMIIQDIAERTNLLALNASIEAARAGDAGRGFAVVATEVKELARQTSSASQDIRSRIEEIQSSAGQAVTSIQQINEVIEKVNRVSRTLAAAVEEQSITTNEIARSVSGASQAAEHASSGVTQSSTACGDISRNIGEVDKVARQTAHDAQETKVSSEKVSEVAKQLRGLVQQFKI